MLRLNSLTRKSCPLWPPFLPQRPISITRNGWGKFCSIRPRFASPGLSMSWQKKIKLQTLSLKLLFRSSCSRNLARDPSWASKLRRKSFLRTWLFLALTWVWPLSRDCTCHTCSFHCCYFCYSVFTRRSSVAAALLLLFSLLCLNSSTICS